LKFVKRLYGEQVEELKTCTSYLSAVPHDLTLRAEILILRSALKNLECSEIES